jgi:FkbM family methyltransferase
MDRFTATRRLLAPLTALRRRRMERQPLPFNRAVFEANAYRPSMRRFFYAAREQPEILVDVDVPSGGVVLDIGAFEGHWARRVVDRATARGVPGLRLHAFEPVQGALAKLRASFADDERVVVHPFGLAGADRTETLTLAGPGSTVFRSAATSFGHDEVPLRDVAGVLAELALDEVAFAKINIEGGEFELLDRLHDTGWLPRISTLLVQFHEFAPGAHRGRRRNRRQLAESHRCTWCYPWVFERWDRR